MLFEECDRISSVLNLDGGQKRLHYATYERVLFIIYSAFKNMIRVDRAFDSLSLFLLSRLFGKNCILFTEQDCWTEGKAGRNITVERISELPELYERPRFGQMGSSQHFGERYSQGRDVYQRYGPGQFASKGYGGKESFRRDFRPNRFPEGKNKDHVMNQHRKNISQKFDDWLD